MQSYIFKINRLKILGTIKLSLQTIALNMFRVEERVGLFVITSLHFKDRDATIVLQTHSIAIVYLYTCLCLQISQVV